MPAAPRSDAAHFPVRPGEEPWTAEELEQVRDEMEAEAVGLRADIARVASEIAERLTDAVQDAGLDFAEHGEFGYDWMQVSRDRAAPNGDESSLSETPTTNLDGSA